MSRPDTTHLTLDHAVKRLAKMAAARQGLSLSAYISMLIRADAEETGLSKLLNEEEVQQ